MRRTLLGMNPSTSMPAVQPMFGVARRAQVFLVAAVLLLAGCGGSSAGTASGIRLVSPSAASEIRDAPPEDLVILDVRTPEEFAEGHLEGALMIDFYDGDFAERIGDLDPSVPYLIYCRSGNRSSQTADIMADLGFDDVAEIDGGIQAWLAADLPTEQP